MGSKPAPTPLAVASLIAMFLLSGAATTILAKAQYSMWSVGVDGSTAQFKRPFFTVLVMFAAMSFVGVVDSCSRHARVCCGRVARSVQRCASDESGAEDPVSGGSMPRGRKILLLSAPAACDTAATAVMSFGLLLVPASVFQILRGSSIFFTAVGSMAMLGKRLRCFEWQGLAGCAVGVVLVGLSQMLSLGGPEREEGGLGRHLLGMGLVLISQAIQATQLVLQEFFLKEVHLPPLTIIGWQGHWGLVFMCLVYLVLWFLPGEDLGHVDDFRQAFVMLANNPALAASTVGFFLAAVCFNVGVIGVTAVLSAIHLSILDAMRTSIVWSFSLLVYYCVDDASGVGEAWTHYSLLEVLGFVLLIVGQRLYAGSFRGHAEATSDTLEACEERAASTVSGTV